MNTRDIKKLEAAYKVLQSIGDELYEDLIDEGCQPGTAMGTLGDIIENVTEIIDRRRKVLCKNGNTVERFYERTTRSSVTVVRDSRGNQLGEADYDGNKESAAFSWKTRIAENGGEAQ